MPITSDTRRLLAAQLAGGQQPVRHPIQGFANLANTFVLAKLLQQADAQDKGKKEARSSDIAAALKAMAGTPDVFDPLSPTALADAPGIERVRAGPGSLGGSLTPGQPADQAEALRILGGSEDQNLQNLALAQAFKGPGAGFSLSAGQTRFGPQGGEIASAPAAPKQRRIVKGADGINRFVDSGEPVFSGVEAPAKPPKSRIRIDGDEEIFEEFDKAQNRFVEKSRGPRFRPPTSNQTVDDNRKLDLVDKIVREQLSDLVAGPEFFGERKIDPDKRARVAARVFKLHVQEKKSVAQTIAQIRKEEASVVRGPDGEPLAEGSFHKQNGVTYQIVNGQAVPVP